MILNCCCSSSRAGLDLLKRVCLLVLILCSTLHSDALLAQNLPERVVVLDPLADTTIPRDRFTPLPGTRLYGEFGRYSNGSGIHHRWNAKTAGYLEFARWDSTWSIAVQGTMEVIMDPLNDIAFNPRAIFWHEGLLVSSRAPWSDGSIQFGYDHRCKHDIDNYEIFSATGEREQRTLIYSGPYLRALARPRTILGDEDQVHLRLGGMVRGDYFVHLFDERWDTSTIRRGESIENLKGALTGTVRMEAQTGGSQSFRFGLHVLAGGMLSSFSSTAIADDGTETGVNDIYVAVPFLEGGVDLINPTGMTFTIFGRGEWQRDGGIVSIPTSASLFLFGVRASASASMW